MRGLGWKRSTQLAALSSAHEVNPEHPTDYERLLAAPKLL
jgi:hypothetical protein